MLPHIQAMTIATTGNATSKHFWLCSRRVKLLVTVLEGSCRCSGQMPSLAGDTRTSQRHSGDQVGRYHLTTLLSKRTIALLHHGHHQTYYCACLQSKLTFTKANPRISPRPHSHIDKDGCPQPSFYFINNKTEARKTISSIIRELNVLDDINLILMTKSYVSICMKSFLKYTISLSAYLTKHF